MKIVENKFNADYFIYDLVKLQEQLYYYALQLTEDREDALDLVQETSFKALKNRGKLHNNDHIRAWLYTILKNTHINYLRSSHYRQLSRDNEDLNSYPAPNSAAHGTPFELLEKKELYNVIGMLPGTYEKPIRMFLSGYSYKEIADQMHIPIGTVKSRIHLGKKQLRRVYTA